MKTLNNSSANSEFPIVVRFSFLNNGSKLKSNYKPATGNMTVSGTLISNNEIVVSHMRVPSLLEVNEVKGGRATLCFSDPLVAAELIEQINNKLVDTNTVDVGITSSDNIIYNVGADVYSSSLTVFNPSVEIIETASLNVSNALRTAPNSETVPFDYEAYLAFRRENNVSDLSQVRAAKSQVNVNKTVI